MVVCLTSVPRCLPLQQQRCTTHLSILHTLFHNTFSTVYIIQSTVYNRTAASQQFGRDELQLSPIDSLTQASAFSPAHVFSPIQPPQIIMFSSSLPHEVNSIQMILYNLHFKVVIFSMPMSRYYSITPLTLRVASYVKLSVKVHNFTQYNSGSCGHVHFIDKLNVRYIQGEAGFGSPSEEESPRSTS